jgi:hypothetical protein
MARGRSTRARRGGRSGSRGLSLQDENIDPPLHEIEEAVPLGDENIQMAGEAESNNAETTHSSRTRGPNRGTETSDDGDGRKSIEILDGRYTYINKMQGNAYITVYCLIYTIIHDSDEPTSEICGSNYYHISIQMGSLTFYH